MDPQTLVQLGLKAVPVAVDKYPMIKERFFKPKKDSRGRNRPDRGYDEYYRRVPARSVDRDSRRNKSRRRSDGGYYSDHRPRRRRYDVSRDQDKDYYYSESESPPPFTRRRRQTLDPELGGGGAAAGAGALALNDNANRNPTKQGHYRSPRSDRAVATRYTPSSSRRSKSQSFGTGTYSSDFDSDSFSSSSSSSSTISVSLTDDEKRARKLKYSVPLSAGVAAIATVHAMNGVHKSLQAHDKRIIQVAKGEMTKEEARELQNKGLVQDVAKIGLGALSIQAAKSKWDQVQGEREQYIEHKRAKRERDRKREEKGEKRRRRRREQRRRRDSDAGRYFHDRDHGYHTDRRDRHRDRDRNGNRDRSNRDRDFKRDRSLARAATLDTSGYREGYNDGYRGRDRGLSRRSEPDISRYVTR